MLIALDIGNSSKKLGFFDAHSLSVCEMETHPLRSEVEYRDWVRGCMREKKVDKSPEGIIISSVVPGHTHVLERVLRGLFSVRPLVIDHTVKTGLRLDVPYPQSVGSDRLANAAAANELFRCPAAVIDFGTATTISVVGSESNYIGGAILPGIHGMNTSLAQGTALLTEVRVTPASAALGVDTETCIMSGLFFGTAGAVERIVSEIEQETGLTLRVVTTGGNSGLISRYLRRVHAVVPYLTLMGLKIIYTRNA